MSTKKEIWRLLEAGEVWQKGDQTLNNLRRWVTPSRKIYGKEVLDVGAMGRRRVTLPEPQGWISVKERMPTKEDANKQGKVLWWDGHNAVSDRIGYAAHATHWSVLSDAPVEEDPDEEAWEEWWRETGSHYGHQSAMEVAFMAGRKSVMTEKEDEA